jgi:hypothetical protein
MVKTMLNKLIRKFFLSVFLSAAILAITNFEAFWHQPNVNEIVNEKLSTQRRARTHLESATNKDAKLSAITNRLKESLLADELGDANPFTGLGTLEPLKEVLSRGVASFERQAYRSPGHKEEFGYDLLVYEITHSDATHSVIMAYLENELQRTEAARVPVVVIQLPTGGSFKQTSYRAGHLLDQLEATADQAQDLVARHMNSSIPFFSVAR